MSFNYQVPFYSNTLDNTHCFQASLRSILKYFWLNKDFSWQELDTITAKAEGLWTWPIATMLWLDSQGFDLRVIEVFDYTKFSTNGENYLYDFYGDETALAQIKHSNIEQEQHLATTLAIKNIVTTKIPSIDDIKESLEDGYLVCCNINSHILNNKPGYSGHFVVITGFTNSTLVLHDPGFPALENRQVTFDDFEKAWAFPNEQAKNILAVKWSKNLPPNI